MGRSWFWNRMAKRYARTPISDQAAYEKKLEITRSYFTPDSSIFEFGCGTGSTAILHAPHVREIWATDVSRNMLAIAREKADAAGIKNIHFEETNIETMSAEGHAFDLILAMSILHLLEDRDAAIAKAYKMLKPGGVFISSTFCVEKFNPVLKAIITFLGMLKIFPFVRFFPADELLNALGKAGFEVERDWQPNPNNALFAVARKPVQI